MYQPFAFSSRFKLADRLINRIINLSLIDEVLITNGIRCRCSESVCNFRRKGIVVFLDHLFHYTKNIIVLFLACSFGPGMSRLRAGLSEANSWNLHSFNVGPDLVVLLQGCVRGVFRLAVIKLGACLFE